MSPAVVWDRALLGYDLGGDHPFNPVRLELTVRLATELGVLSGVELLVPTGAGDEELLRVHAPEYLAAVREAPLVGWEVGHGLGTADNPVFSDMHDASALVVGSTLLAARKVAEGEATRAVNIAGGLHHAMRDQAAGFCVYNDCAVAISWLLDHGFDRIAYIDTDVHHGDGVQAAFYDDPRVLTISMHQHPFTLWPGTGYSAETGRGKADGTSVNVPLPPRTRDPGGCAPSTPSSLRCSPTSSRSCCSPSAASTRTRKTRWPTSRSASTGTAPSTPPCASSPRPTPAASGSPSAGAGTS